MQEEFKDCSVGALVIGLVLALITALANIGGTGTEELSAVNIGIIVFIGYFVFSLVAYGFLAISRNQLDSHGFMFVVATLVVSAGSWWLMHGMSFLNVKMTEGIYKLLFKRKALETVQENSEINVTPSE